MTAVVFVKPEKQARSTTSSEIRARNYLAFIEITKQNIIRCLCNTECIMKLCKIDYI